jgi:uncharacterized protein (TIGR00106 family)
MLAQLSIWPIDDPHMSNDIADVVEVLEQSGVHFEVGPMSTTIEGEWHDVMTAIHACHEALRATHKRVLTNIMIDDDATRPLNIREAKTKVDARRKAKS